MFFISRAIKKYREVNKNLELDYNAYKTRLQNQLKVQKLLLSEYGQAKEDLPPELIKKPKEKQFTYSLKEEMKPAYDFFLASLLTIHFTQLLPQISSEQKMAVFAGILEMQPEDRTILYEEWCHLEHLPHLPDSSKSAIDIAKVLERYPFSYARKAYLIIKFGHDLLNLQTKWKSPVNQTFHPLNFSEAILFCDILDNFTNCLIPEEMFFYILTGHILDKAVLPTLKKMGTFREQILKNNKYDFFIPIEVLQEIKESISKFAEYFRLPPIYYLKGKFHLREDQQEPDSVGPTEKIRSEIFPKVMRINTSHTLLPVPILLSYPIRSPKLFILFYISFKASMIRKISLLIYGL